MGAGTSTFPHGQSGSGSGSYVHDPALAHLLSCLFFIKALYVLKHKVGRRESVAADALFHNNVIDFFALLTQATLDPLPISPDLIKIGHQHIPDVDVRTLCKGSLCPHQKFIGLSAVALPNVLWCQPAVTTSSLGGGPLPFCCVPGPARPHPSVHYLASFRGIKPGDCMGGQPVGRDWMPWLQLVVRGIARSPSPHLTCPKRLPITGPLCTSSGVWANHDFELKLMWTVCCVCYFGFMMAGEFTAVVSL